MRGKWKEKRWQYLFAGLLFLAGGWSLIRMVMPEESWDFGIETLEQSGGYYFEANVVDENDPGWYVDNSMEYGEVFVQSPKVDLKTGSYDVTINYRSQGEGSGYSFFSDDATYRTLLGRVDESLEGGRKNKTMSVSYLRKVEGFSVSIHYGGDGYLLVSSIQICQTRALERMLLASVLFIGGCWLIVARYIKERNVKRLLAYGAIVAGLASLPTMMPYLYDGDDLVFHLLRIEGIAEGLKAGQFPVRIQPHWMNGYGYPVSVFYGEGVLGAAGILRWIGFPLQLSYKLYILFVNFLTFFITWFSCMRLTDDKRIAGVGAVLYVLAPYRLMNIYGRAAVGEYTAMAFLPLVLVGSYEILMVDEKKRRCSWLVLAFGMTGIIQSHILTCEIVVLILGITCLVCWRKILESSRLMDFIKAAACTILLNMEFLVPFLDYMREDFFVNSADFDHYIQTHGTFINQLLALLPHGYGQECSVVDGLRSGAEKTVSLGVAFLAVMVIYLAEKRKNADHNSKIWKLGQYCFGTGIALVVMSTVWFPWDFLHDLNGVFAVLISRLQFPWRILGAASLMFSILSCVVLYNLKETGRKAVIGLEFFLVIAAGLTAGYYISSLTEANNVIYVADVESIGTFEIMGGEYIPDGVSWSAEKMVQGKVWHGEELVVTRKMKRGSNFELECENLSDEVQTVDLPMTYYRGFIAKDRDSGERIALKTGENGRIRLMIPEQYQGVVSVQFQEPVLWRIANVITLLSVIAIGYYLWKNVHGHQKAEERDGVQQVEN